MSTELSGSYAMNEREEAFAQYLRVERGLAEATIKGYVRYVQAFLSFRDTLPDSTSTDPADEVRAWLYATGGSASSVTCRLAALRCWARFARIPDPTADVDRPKRRQGLPRPVDDLTQRLAAMDTLTRWAAVFLSETGLRLSEACGVRVTEVPDELLIRGKGGRERLVPLTERAQQALRALGGSIPWSPRQLERRFRAHGFTPHQLRHTFATELAESGADLGEIQDLLGHASPATTRVYARYSTERLRRALDRRSAR